MGLKKQNMELFMDKQHFTAFVEVNDRRPCLLLKLFCYRTSFANPVPMYRTRG
jgi:hypothetical protein